MAETMTEGRVLEQEGVMKRALTIVFLLAVMLCACGEEDKLEEDDLYGPECTALLNQAIVCFNVQNWECFSETDDKICGDFDESLVIPLEAACKYLIDYTDCVWRHAHMYAKRAYPETYLEWEIYDEWDDLFPDPIVYDVFAVCEFEAWAVNIAPCMGED